MTIDVKRNLIVAFGSLVMMMLGSVYSYSVFRAPIENIFNVGSAASGFPYMFALAFYAVSMLLTGRRMHLLKPQQWVFLGGAIMSVGWILSSFASNIWMLTVTYGIIGGTGVGISYGVLMDVTAKWFPDKKGLALGIVLVGFGLSPLVMAQVSRILLSHYGILKSFLLLGVSFACALLALSFVFKYPSLIEQEQLSSKFNSTYRKNLTPKFENRSIDDYKFKGLYFNFFIGSMIGLLIIGMTTNIGVDYFRIKKEVVTIYIAVFAMFNGLGRPLFGWIVDRFSSRTAMKTSFVLIGIAALMSLFFHHIQGVFAIAFSLFWMNLGAWLSIAPTTTLNLFGQIQYSEKYGIVFTAYGLGAIVGVLISGLLIDFHGDYSFVFLFILFATLLGLIVTHVTIKPSH